MSWIRYFSFVVLIGLAALSARAELLTPVFTEEPVYQVQRVDDRLFLLGRSGLYTLDSSKASKPVLVAEKRIDHAEMHDEALFLGAEDGLFRLKSVGNFFEVGEESFGPQGKSRVGALRSWEGRLWVGTNRGLWVLGEEQPRVSSRVLDLKIIKEELWVVHPHMITVLDSSGESSVISKPSSAGENSVLHSVVTAGDEVWVKTIGNKTFGRFGRVYQFDGTTLVEAAPELREVVAVHRIGSNTWFGAAEGIFRQRLGDPSLVPISTGSAVNVLFEYGDGVWVGATQGLYFWSYSGGLHQVFMGSVHSIQEIFDGEIWVASQQGVFKYDGDIKPEVLGELDVWFGFLTGGDLKVRRVGYAGEELTERGAWQWCLGKNELEVRSAESCLPASPAASKELSLGYHSIYVQFRDPFGNHSEVIPYSFWSLSVPRGLQYVLLLGVLFLVWRLRVAKRDELTGLERRKSGEKEMVWSCRSCGLRGKPWSVLFLDIDKFKAFNDNFGHDFGDRVLTSVASVLIDSCRNGDIPIRWAGDEFVVFVPAAGKKTAEKIAGRIVAAVAPEDADAAQDAGAGVPVDEKKVATVSIGGYSSEAAGRGWMMRLVRALAAKSAVEAGIEAADGAMYKAKAGGGNKVEWHES